MLNTVNIMGRLVRDPELRYTTSQKPVASFTLAVERDFAPSGGERGVDFIQCVAWNGTADFVDKWFKKGSRAVVTGRLQMREWKDNDGNKRTAAEVVADKVYFGESKTADRGADDAQGGDGELPF
jgi:single-strand DNA-binding protein